MTPEEEKALRDTLESAWPAIEAARAELEGYVRQVCARLERKSEMRPRFIEARPKPFTSVIRKMRESAARPDELLQAVGDLIGARVVVYNLSDVELFEKDVLEDAASPLAAMTSEKIEYPTGYRAVHVNGKIGDYGAEIQIRTAVQDAWAVTSRADVYRAGESPLVSSLSAAQSLILHGVDAVLQEIRDLSEKSRGDEATIAETETDDEQPQVSAPRVGLDDTRLRAAKELLSPEDHFVLDTAVSDKRIAELESGIEGERGSSGIRRIFRAAGRYARLHEYRHDARFGNRMLVWKGPLVEGSNWGTLHPSDFGRGLEGFLVDQLGQLLERRVTENRVLASWDEIASFIDEGTQRLRDAGGEPDLLVMQGGVRQALNLEVLSNGDWTQTPFIRGVNFSQEPLVRQVVRGLPLLRIHGDELPPSMHIIDVTDLSYTQTNPDAMSDEDLLLRIEEINWESAAETFDANPDMAASLHRSWREEEGRLNREEAVVFLQLQVRLHVLEGGMIRDQGDSSRHESVTLAENE